MPNKDEEGHAADAQEGEVSRAHHAPVVEQFIADAPIAPDAPPAGPVADLPAASQLGNVSVPPVVNAPVPPVVNAPVPPVVNAPVAPVADVPVPPISDKPSSGSVVEEPVPVADANTPPVAKEAPVADANAPPVAKAASVVDRNAPPIADVNARPVSDAAPVSSISIPRPHGRHIPDVPTAATGAVPKKKLTQKPSKDGGKSESRNVPGTSGYINPNVAGPSGSQRTGMADPFATQGVPSSEHRTSDPTPVGLADQAQAMPTSESMPSMSPNPHPPQSRSLFKKVKRFLSRHLNLNIGKKKQHEDDSRHVMEPDSEGSPSEQPPLPPVDLERYRPFPRRTFNYWTFYDPVLPYEEVNERCKAEWKSEIYIYERAKSLTEDISSMADFAGDELPEDSDSIAEAVVQAFEDDFVVPDLEDKPVVLGIAPIPDPEMEDLPHIPDPDGNIVPIPDPEIEDVALMPDPEAGNVDPIPDNEVDDIVDVPEFENVAFEPDPEAANLANMPHRVDINVVNVPDHLAGARLNIAVPVEVNVADLVAAGIHDPFVLPVAPVPEIGDAENIAGPPHGEFLTVSQRVAEDIAEELRLKAYHRGSPC